MADPTRYASTVRRTCCLLIVAVLLLGGSTARASRPAAGKWVATFSTSSNARMSFTVNRAGTRMTHIVVRSFHVFCISTDDSSFDTWTFPSTSVSRTGAFARIHRTSVGSSTQKYRLRGRFTSPTRARGYAEEQSLSGYCVGGAKWRAHRR